ncbi:MAG: hypothetical protein KAZ87_00045 [Spirochaetes bacterium]|nr:hypothetical protein [Spirochaetota bacterium]
MATADTKRLERRAKYMLLSKDIPSAKMDVVKSLLSNDRLLPEEKYGAVIDLVKNCPDKKTETEGRKIEPAPKITVKRKSAPSFVPVLSGQASSSVFIDELFAKYHHLNVFKKKYLMHSGNWLSLTIKKRLVPSKKFFRILSEINAHQEKILPRIVSVCDMIVADEQITDPLIFNYLRTLSSWLSLSPMSSLDYGKAKWHDAPTFENEFRQYLFYAFSFNLLSLDTKEKIILSFETKLREMKDLAKETVMPEDSDSTRNGKESRNLKKEKIIFDCMLTIRSFIPTVTEAKGSLDKILENKYGFSSLCSFLSVCFECLIFRRPVTENEIISYYSITPVQSKSDSWNCSAETLKKHGKDEESIKQKKIQSIRTELKHLDEIVEMIGMKFEGSDILFSSFEEQWKIINKRRIDTLSVKNDDYMTFITELLHFFEKAFLPFLDGSIMTFSYGKNRVESSIFTKNSFERRMSVYTDILKDLNTYKINVPNEKISKEEARKIINGSIKTMDHISSFFSRISAIFFSFAFDLHLLLNVHEKTSSESNATIDIRQPVNIRDITDYSAALIPFYDSVFIASENMHPALKMNSGKAVFTDSGREGLFKLILSFCYQISYELSSEELLKELEKRRELRNEIKLLGGNV